MRTNIIAIVLLLLSIVSTDPGLGGQQSSNDGGPVEAVTTAKTFVSSIAEAGIIQLTIPSNGKASFGSIYPGDNSKQSTLSIYADGGWKLKVSGDRLYNSYHGYLSRYLKVSVLNPSNSGQRTSPISTENNPYILQSQVAVGTVNNPYALTPIYYQTVTSTDHVYGQHNDYSTTVTWTAESQEF
jgi:hypothetical protein